MPMNAVMQGEGGTARATGLGAPYEMAGKSGTAQLAGDAAPSGLRDPVSDAADLRQMAAILNGLRALGSGRVLGEVLTLVMDSALDVTGGRCDGDRGSGGENTPGCGAAGRAR